MIKCTKNRITLAAKREADWKETEARHREL